MVDLVTKYINFCFVNSISKAILMLTKLYSINVAKSTTDFWTNTNFKFKFKFSVQIHNFNRLRHGTNLLLLVLLISTEKRRNALDVTIKIFEKCKVCTSENEYNNFW